MALSKEGNALEEGVSALIILWDSNTKPPQHPGLTYTWDGYSEQETVRSLYRYVEAHGERLREKYLSWIHELGQSRIRQKRLIDHLVIQDGLSYWWMTLFVEKSPWKSPAIKDAIRLFAVEEIILRDKPKKLQLVSVNQKLHQVLSGLCQNSGIAYEWKSPPGAPKRKWSLSGIYQALPMFLQGLISLRHLFRAWRLKKSTKPKWFSGSKTVFFCSYFIHLCKESYKRGEFYSHQWAELPELLQYEGYNINWLQHYMESNVVPDTQVAIRGIKSFNESGEEQGLHAFIYSYITWGVVLRVLKDWLKLTFLSFHLRGIRAAFYPNESCFSLWPLMKHDWIASLRGPVAIRNLLWVELFNEALGDLPHQQMGLYLCENQSWERAFIHAWRKFGHGQVIAIAHTTVRFWDLRYFADPRTVRSSAEYGIPKADLTALNGRQAINAYLSASFPKEEIVECEALRFGYLPNLRSRIRSRKSRSNRRRIRVLVLGDFFPSNTKKMLRLLEGAIPHISNPTTYTLTSHPGLIVNPEDYPSLSLKMVTNSLSEILHEFDVAYSANVTSASVEACLAGLPVVVMLDEKDLNFSPLLGESGVLFVSEPNELAEALDRVGHYSELDRDHDEFFFLDPEFSRWKQLLLGKPIC